jgi:hypothetical protein
MPVLRLAGYKTGLGQSGQARSSALSGPDAARVTGSQRLIGGWPRPRSHTPSLAQAGFQSEPGMANFRAWLFFRFLCRLPSAASASGCHAGRVTVGEWPRLHHVTVVQMSHLKAASATRKRALPRAWSLPEGQTGSALQVASHAGCLTPEGPVVITMEHNHGCAVPATATE